MTSGQPEMPVPDADVTEEMGMIVDGDLPDRDRRTRGKSVAGAALAAAMLGVGEIIEPQNTEVGIEEAGDAFEPEGDDLMSHLSFGDLPPLN